MLTKELLTDHSVIATKRSLIRSALASDNEQDYVAIIGPCSMDENVDLLVQETKELKEFEEIYSNVCVIHRTPVWKPRSNPADWHGLETTDPELAFDTLNEIAAIIGGAAIEIGKPEHVSKYGSLLAFAWTGARNANNYRLHQSLSELHGLLPLGFKNALDGEIAPVLRQTIDLASDRVVIFRGGSNLMTPKKWAEAFKSLCELTGGKFVVDVAHGTEMAHDPSGGFKKTKIGQKMAIEHVIDLKGKGFKAKGIMIEASSINSITDPNIDLQFALDAVKEIANLKRNENII